MAHYHHVANCLAKFMARLLDRTTDETCVARIEEYLARNMLASMEISPSQDSRVRLEISRAVAQMEPLTRSVLILIVTHKMSVAEISHRFGMSQERVCEHFRLAVETVTMRKRSDRFAVRSNAPGAAPD